MGGSCPWAWLVPAADVGCEPARCAWIVHPAEAWSNVAFLVVGGALLFWYGQTDRKLPGVVGPARLSTTFLALLAAGVALAAVTLWLDKGRVARVGGALAHVVQPHSFWHVLSALSLFFVYRYERRVEHALAATARAAV